MKVAIASGKGGTGKTTVSTNLAFVAAQSERKVHLLDCDVEEPNCHIFVKPQIETTEKVFIPVPEVDLDKCTGCGECAEICQFNAIVNIKGSVLTFPEMCHGCGGCWLVCPEKAISVGSREVGVLEHGTAFNFQFTQGRLRIGETMSPPLIRKVKASQNNADLTIIDSPPGTSCPVIAAIRGCDFVILVTEPTPFGLNDLILAVEMVRVLDIPFFVLINRADIGDDRVREYCQRKAIPILLEIADDRSVAEAYSRGEMAASAIPQFRDTFDQIISSLEDSVI